MIPYVCVCSRKKFLWPANNRKQSRRELNEEKEQNGERRLFSWLTDNERERCIVLPLAFSDAANIAPLAS
jgi:hypothetical protein